MEKEEISVEKTTEPKKDVVKEEQNDTEKFALPKGPTIAGTAVITLLAGSIIFGYLGYYITKNFISPRPVYITEQCVECEECKECEETECTVKEEKECKCPNSQITLFNEGWMKHISSDVKLNLETPSYSGRQDLAGEQILFTWDVRISKTEHSESLDFKNYIKTISAHYVPVSLPEGFGCGAGCAKENVINIQVFKNSSNLTLEKARDQLLSNVDPETGKITGEIKNKWGERTYEYLWEGVGGQLQGNLVVKNGNIYQATYYLAGEGESLNIANKVLDSIRFN